MANRVIAFDNSVMSALVQSALNPKKLKPEDRTRAERAFSLIERIKKANLELKAEDRTAIQIPVPALSECFALWETEKHIEVLEVLKRQLNAALIPFDLNAGLHAAKIRAEMRAKGRTIPGSRDCIKFDLQIIACCMAHSVQTLYHDDGDFDSLSGLKSCKDLNFMRLPAHGDQRELYKGPNHEQAKEKDKEA